MKSTNPIVQSTIHLIRFRLALSALVLALAAGSSNLGATDFGSLHDGSWFDAPNTWGQASSPGNGDDVYITKLVNFDSTTIGQSVTVSNLDMDGGTLSVGGPAMLGMAGTNSYWNNATMGGSLLQLGSLTLAGTNTIGNLSNQGVVQQPGTATLNIGEYSTHFNNQAGGTYDIEGDGGIINSDNAWFTSFNNSALLRKSGGSGTSIIGVPFDNSDGTIEVDSGTLSLAAGGTSASGTFNVAAGAVLDLTGGSSPTWSGLVNGSGAGTVSLNSGTVATSPSLTLDFPDGLFQWTGGWLSGTTINSGVVTIAGSGTAGVAGGFYNSGLVRQTNAATLDIGVNYAHFENQAGGTYDLEGDGSIMNAPAYYTSFNNYGLLRKSAGSGTSTISAPLNNLNGSIEVDSGTLSLADSGSSSNGTFTVAAGAVLDLTGGSSSTWAGQVTGSGTGIVSLNSGTLYTSPSLTLNLPDGLLQWTGGWFWGTTINSNVVTISGTNTVSTTGVFYNSGLMRHTGTATLGIENSAHFQNLADGTYEFTGDGNIIGVDTAYYPGYFDNFGLLRKSGGAGPSAFGNRAWCNNQNGSIEVDSGQLSLSGQSYAQGSGSFIVTLGGTNAGQSGQLLCGPTTLGGPLNVKLASGYVPVIGDQFQILSSGGLSGAFTTLNVPAGIAVTYTNDSVFLVVTGTVPVQITSPTLAGNGFSFSFGTVSNQSYTVQRNDDLTTANWIYYTNFTGNGSLMQVIAPVAGTVQRFYRVREP